MPLFPPNSWEATSGKAPEQDPHKEGPGICAHCGKGSDRNSPDPEGAHWQGKGRGPESSKAESGSEEKEVAPAQVGQGGGWGAPRASCARATGMAEAMATAPACPSTSSSPHMPLSLCLTLTVGKAFGEALGQGCHRLCQGFPQERAPPVPPKSASVQAKGPVGKQEDNSDRSSKESDSEGEKPAAMTPAQVRSAKPPRYHHLLLS